MAKITVAKLRPQSNNVVQSEFEQLKADNAKLRKENAYLEESCDAAYKAGRTFCDEKRAVERQLERAIDAACQLGGVTVGESPQLRARNFLSEFSNAQSQDLLALGLGFDPATAGSAEVARLVSLPAIFQRMSIRVAGANQLEALLTERVVTK